MQASSFSLERPIICSLAVRAVSASLDSAISEGHRHDDGRYDPIFAQELPPPLIGGNVIKHAW
jgi:hypothetical protein